MISSEPDLDIIGQNVTHSENLKHYQIDGLRREYLTKTGRGEFLFSTVGGVLSS